jgi:hypothetical protein
MFLYAMVEAQSPYLELLPNSVSMQIKAHATDSLSLFYKVVYHGTGVDSLFTGVVYTNYYTTKYKVPTIAHDSFNTATQIPALPIKNLDTFRIFCHIPVDPGYFGNGRSNLIVVWPTGAKQSNKSIVSCDDTFKYTTAVEISGLSGIDNQFDTSTLVNIFPNPANTILNIELNDPTVEISQIQILNAVGQVLKRLDGTTSKIDLTMLRNGIYFLELTCKDGQKATYSFVIKR